MIRLRLLAVTLLAFSLIACGGGGGSSSGSSPYTGITTAAVITSTNADNIIRSAYQGGDASTAFVSPLSASTSEPQNVSTASPPKVYSIVQVLKEISGKACGQRFTAGKVAPKAVVSESGTLNDGYGGSVSYSLSVDDQSGAFTGSFTASNYHGDGGGTISGAMTVSGTYNIALDVFDNINFTLSSVTVTDASSSVTVSGSVVLLNGNPATGTVTLYLTDNVTGKTDWIDNFMINVTEGLGYVDATLSGKIYLHDYGYVVISTSTPFRFLAGSTYPSSGTMIVTGASNGRAKLTVVNSTSYTIDVDANGDGTYETSSSHTW
ncbi:MAG: hypothetical protein M0T69_08515 [Deltaproteobacteria bacterium]|nr:hypothetical protein [Deltaproteobacteria bacterium]